MAINCTVLRSPICWIASGQSTVVVIEGQQAPAPVERPPPPPPLAPEIAFERDPVNAIAVDENAKVTQPLVKDAAAELRTGRPNHEGIIRTPSRCVDVRASKGSISRTVRILQALFLALETRGYSVAIKGGQTFITVLGESYSVFLKERARRTILRLASSRSTSATTADLPRRRREERAPEPAHRFTI